MNDTTSDQGLAAAAQLLAASPDYRILRRIDETTLTMTPVTADEPLRTGVVVDVETTYASDSDRIVERR